MSSKGTQVVVLFYLTEFIYFLKGNSNQIWKPEGTRWISVSKNHVSKNRAFDFLKWSLKSHREIHKSTNWILMENQGYVFERLLDEALKILNSRSYQLVWQHWLHPNSFVFKWDDEIWRTKEGRNLLKTMGLSIPPFFLSAFICLLSPLAVSGCTSPTRFLVLVLYALQESKSYL